jgi:urease accessory protein
MVAAALLLLADGRLPAGGHVHSGGVEAAVDSGAIHDVGSLRDFLRGRLFTVGLVTAALAVSACACAVDGDLPGLAALDALADARTPSPAQRAASRAQGRALLRLAGQAWPSAGYAALGATPHHPLVLGVAVAASGGQPSDAAVVAASAAVGGPASAAVRLLGLDPLAVTAMHAALAGDIDHVATTAVAQPDSCPGAPLLDLLAEAHAASAVPLFAS